MITVTIIGSVVVNSCTVVGFHIVAIAILPPSPGSQITIIYLYYTERAMSLCIRAIDVQ